MRVPRAFKTLHSLGCIRLNLGPLDKRAAQVAARTLAVSARQALVAAEGHVMTAEHLDKRVDRAAIRTAILAKLRQDVEFLIPLHDGNTETGPAAAARLDRRIRDIDIALAGAEVAAAAISDQAPPANRRLDELIAAV